MVSKSGRLTRDISKAVLELRDHLDSFRVVFLNKFWGVEIQEEHQGELDDALDRDHLPHCWVYYVLAL